MTDADRIQELVEQALGEHRTAEDVCREFPDLIAHVRERLAQVVELDEALEILLPVEGVDAHAVARESVDPALPRIPGYEVKEILGRGGMGVVYRARHLRLERDVALKMLIAGEFAGPRESRRFLLEAQAIANLSHPNIVQVHDVGENEGRAYFTMELVEGGTLARWLGGAPQPAEKAAELVCSIAGAVHVAHANGIVHRDLKPANVMLTHEGAPKVTDFGLARRLSGERDLTVSGTILGTPSYMAPEQIQGDEIGCGVDVYALGAILYEILTGRPPFRSDSPLATQMQVLSEEPVRPTLLNGRIPRDIETICLCCLHKSASRRYGSAAALAADLRRFLAHEPIRARSVGPLERGLLWTRRNPARSLAVLVVVALIGAWSTRAIRNQALVKERRDREAAWAPRIDDMLERLRSGEFDQARSVLDEIPDTLGEEFRQRVIRARRELLLVEQLDGIRLRRVDITEGRFDRSENRRAADLEYADAFRVAGVGSMAEDPAIVAARVQAASVRTALVGALDDWAFCAGDGPRAAWLLEVVRLSDPAASPWRDRLHEPPMRLDRGSASLTELMNELRANRVTLQLLVGAAERMREGGIDPVPMLEAVQSVHPGDFWVNFSLADLRWQDPREAIRYAQAAVAIRPRAAIAHQALGTALRKSGREDEGLESYRRAVLVEPDFAEAHGRLGLVLQESGALDESIVEMRAAIRLDPGLAWAHHNLGVALCRKGLDQEALGPYRETLRLDSRSGLAQHNLARCLSGLGLTRQALAAFRGALEVEDTLEHRYDYANCLARVGDLDEAEVAYRRVLERDPAHAASRVELRMVLVRMGRGDEALALQRTAIEATPADSAGWEGFPELCAFLERREDYLRACEELLDRFGSSGEPRECERIGRACLLLPLESTLPRAAALIERALHSTNAGEWTLPYFEFAQALADLRGGRFERAVEGLAGEAGEALAPAPELIRGMALYRLGFVAEARSNLAAAALGCDWSPSAAGDHDSWIRHVLRREAQDLILPRLSELLTSRDAPTDDELRAAMVAACVAASRDAAAARLFAQFEEPLIGWDRGRRQLAARVLARAGAGLGADPADAAEQASFRVLVRSLLQADLAACQACVDARGPDWRAAARSILQTWLNEPAYEWLRNLEVLSSRSQSEREDDRAMWLGVETLIRRIELDP